VEIKGIHLDTDSYYWLPTDPPFTQKRDPAARIALIERDVSDAPNWVLSGSPRGGSLLATFKAQLVYLRERTSDCLCIGVDDASRVRV
jgi:hypothetical protein